MKVKKTPYHSFHAGEFAEGCKYCVRGEKLVLFVTGLCPARCEFCPVSDKKIYKDVIYANERPLKSKDETKAIVEEAKACSARGAGITGGDPLVVLDRTIGYIRLLKKTFGKRFHIHLYTPLNLVTEKNLTRLYEAGLDEIRFHLKVGDEKLWPRLGLAKKFSWSVGVEIPVLPGKGQESKRLIDFIKGKADFLNLNELELADNQVWKKVKDVKCKDDASYAIKGSDELAQELLAYSAKKGIRTHYCTCKLKDSVQLAKRIKRRALNVHECFDIVTEEGMLFRGAIYLPEMSPGFGYRRKLERLSAADKRKALKTLMIIKKRLIKEQGMPSELLVIDENKLRLVTGADVVGRIRPLEGIGFRLAVVTEYPTFDALEIDVEFI
ncbi:MAG: radical SAM protein [archaeon]